MALIIDLILSAVAIFLVLVCAKRGLIKSVIHFAKVILALLLAYWLGSAMGSWLCDSFIHEPIYDAVHEKIEAVYEEQTGGLDARQVMDALPSFVLTDEVKAELEAAEGDGEALIASMSESVARPISELVSSIVGYVLVFALAFVGLAIVAAILSKISDQIRILGALNTGLGALLGLLIAVVVLSVVASLVKAFFWNTDFYTDTVVLEFFGESGLLKSLKFLDLSALVGK